MKKILILFSMTFVIQANAQKRSLIYSYIERLGLTAINTMHESKIPASIIMAIAIEESAAGTSEVAKRAKNHFGMKAGNTWKGSVYRTTRNSLFRSYEDDKQSVEAFASLLRSNKQYQFLFGFAKNDYKSWAKGIAKSGYCSGNSAYANRLITIIENHQLYNLDECLWEFK